jgi:hypothetical protein
MHYAEYINKHNNINKDVLICAYMNALEGKDINIQDYIDEVLIQKQEYEDGLRVANKLTEEYNKNNYPNIKVVTHGICNYPNNEGDVCYDASTNKMYIISNGMPCEITNR